MGSNKNKLHHRNNHRNVYRKRKIPTTVSATVNVEGSRIVNMDRLQTYTDELVKHSMRCSGSVSLIGEKEMA